MHEQPRCLELPLAKAEYLLTRAAELGQGGDKQNFWRGVMGFESAADIREALLALSTEIFHKDKMPLGSYIEPIFVLLALQVYHGRFGRFGLCGLAKTWQGLLQQYQTDREDRNEVSTI